ncbi:hypothetical protein H6F43_12830, partial [Leptolyngbya sp. FACHB-36]|nr:hypothetical protein [Leptolyngbya sp. FACHB-36]
MESQVFGILVVAAFGLLLVVSVGIGYLTLAEWRDRRRRENALREERSVERKPGKAK